MAKVTKKDLHHIGKGLANNFTVANKAEGIP